MRRHLRIILLLALAACAHPRASQPANPADAETVAALDERWLTAYDRHDSTAIRAIFAPEATMIHASGRTSGTEDEVRGVMQSNPPGVVAQWRTEGRRVTVYGQAALATGRYTLQGTYQGEAFARRYHYSSLYARRDGEWRLVHVHFSAIPNE